MYYKVLIAWHKFTNSTEQYIDAQLQKANETNAPKDAIYMKGNGEWATIDEIENKHALKYIIHFINN